MDFDFLIPIAIFGFVAYVIKVISDNRLRSRVIEKGLLDENVKFLYTQNCEGRQLSSFKWGLVLIGIGGALLIGQMFPYHISHEMTVGGMFLMAGIAFLIYYLVTRKQLVENTPEEK